MIRSIEHVEDGHTRRATVTRESIGWRFQEQRDSVVVRDVTYRDWHRVELAIRTFECGGLRLDHSTNR